MAGTVIWRLLLVGITALGGALSPLWNSGRAEGVRGFLRGASTSYVLLR